MCALVTGVQTCALPISELGQDAERVADPHVPGPAARHLPRPRHHGDGARPEPAGRRPARFAGPAPQAPRLGRATMSLLSVRGLSVSLDTQEGPLAILQDRSEEHTSELQSLMRISYAVFCLKKQIAYPHHIN